METLKTLVVVTCLLGVLFGVYKILNKEDVPPPQEVAAALEDGIPGIEINFDGPGFSESSDGDGMDGMDGLALPPGIDPGSSTNGGLDIPELPVSPVDASPSIDAPPVDTALPPISPAPGASDPLEIPTLSPSSTNSPPSANVMAPLPPTTDVAAPPVSPTITPPTLGADLASSDSTSGSPTPDVPIEAVPSFPSTNNNTTDDNATTPALTAPPAGTDTAIVPPPVNVTPIPELPTDSAIAPAPELAAATPSLPGVEPAPPQIGAVATTPAASADGSEELTQFQRAARTAKAQIDAKQYRQALFTLSLFYDDPALTSQERVELLDLLDPLAGRVIYSREHMLTSAHVLAQGETIEAVAAKYQVPVQLLININGIQRPEALASGTELKVVPGPFRAEVDTQRGELTLFLQRMYAGRFPISVGNDPTPKPGEFAIKEKTMGQTYYGESGVSVPAAAPSNPYGKHWLDLGSLSIHGSPQQPTNISNGCISLSPRDATDVYNILTIGSKVVITR